MKEKAMKSCKKYCIILLICIVIVLGFIISNMVSLIKVQNAKANDFSVSEVYDKDMDMSFWHLVANGKDYGNIDYNEYNQIDTDGQHHYKTQMIINEVSIMMGEAIVLLTLVVILYMIYGCTKDFIPFSMKNVYGLRIISISIILIALLPGAVKLLLSFLVYLQSSGSIDFQCVMIFLLGAAIGAISEIFLYGNKLQKEMDLIA